MFYKNDTNEVYSLKILANQTFQRTVKFIMVDLL